MAKTNPIGVRFNPDMLRAFEEDGLADSPQKALNFLTDFYFKNRTDTVDFKKLLEKLPATTQNKTNTDPGPEKPRKGSKKEDKPATVKETDSVAPERHKLWKPTDPREGTGAFFLKYDCNTYSELEKIKK